MVVFNNRHINTNKKMNNTINRLEKLKISKVYPLKTLIDQLKFVLQYPELNTQSLNYLAFLIEQSAIDVENYRAQYNTSIMVFYNETIQNNCLSFESINRRHKDATFCELNLNGLCDEFLEKLKATIASVNDVSNIIIDYKQNLKLNQNKLNK